MEIKWYGHSCFLLTSSRGTRILMDPCSPDTGYALGPIQADAVTCSHDHYDHNYVPAAVENPMIIRGPGEHLVKDTLIKGVPAWHDDAQGGKRGPNMMYIVQMDDMRILHAGDIGHLPDEESLGMIGDIDVFLVPVGGVYTINYLQALEMANMLRPSVVIPMHYKTPHCTVDLGELAPFISTAKDCKIHRLNQSEATLSRESLGEDRVLVLDYEK
jgi:L-ascorbate metabolism protein UlaG (beta-lactamase superfamily)